MTRASKAAPADRFGPEYFDRFYHNPATRASSPEDFARLARFVLAYLAYLEIPVRDVLDLGCGLGRWKSALAAHDPKIRYTGVDASPYLCREFGWTQASVDEFQSRRKFDLVICQDVLPYLPARRLQNAVATVARHCRGAAYLQVITNEDWLENKVDPGRTDAAMHRFDAAWYRQVFGRHFINCGGGLFIPRESDAVLWTMEHC